MSDIDEEIDDLDWEKMELIPAVTQDENGQVLMLAYMDKEALRKTLETGYAHYYSRSKERIWKKGEVSGNVQKVKGIKKDCDEDALLLKVEQKGEACHTGERSCFYRELDEVKDEIEGIDYSLNILKELEEVVRDRRNNPTDESYTCELFEKGEEEIKKKLGEESVEVLVAKDKENVIYESADLLYHLLVLLRYEGIDLKEVMEELEKRRG